MSTGRPPSTEALCSGPEPMREGAEVLINPKTPLSLSEVRRWQKSRWNRRSGAAISVLFHFQSRKKKWDVIRFAFQKDHSHRRGRDLEEVRREVGQLMRRFERMQVSEGPEPKPGWLQ